jgi:hypothetical protein
MVDFKFLNILVNHKTQLAMINMSLKEHHTCIFLNAILNMIWHGFWLIVLCFYPLVIICWALMITIFYFLKWSNQGARLSFFPHGVLVYIIGGANYC